MVLVSARCLPPLILAYHLRRKSLLYAMRLNGWPRPLHSFVVPPYGAPVMGLVSCLGAGAGSSSSSGGSHSGSSGVGGGGGGAVSGGAHTRMLSLLDLQTGKEVLEARQFIYCGIGATLVHSSTTAAAAATAAATSAREPPVNVVFGCNAAQSLAAQTLVMGQDTALHVFGNVLDHPLDALERR